MNIFLLADILPKLYRDPETNTDIDFTSIDQIGIVIGNIIQILLVAVGFLAVIYIIYASILYIVSEGEPAKTASAKSGIVHAIFGLVLSSGAYLLISFITRTIQ